MKFKSPAHAACVFIFNDLNQVFTVTRRHTDILSLPGGKVDFGEDVAQSASREVLEETGMYVGVINLIPVYSEVVIGKDDGVDYYSTAFVSDFIINSKLPQFQKPYEIEPGIWCRFATIEELLKGAFSDFNRSALICISRITV